LLAEAVCSEERKSSPSAGGKANNFRARSDPRKNRALPRKNGSEAQNFTFLTAPREIFLAIYSSGLIGLCRTDSAYFHQYETLAKKINRLPMKIIYLK